MKVISASRRVDMVAGYPDLLIELLNSRCPPEKVHSIVLWTKNAANLTTHQSLISTLAKYDQLFLHFSITGMGGTLFEPHIPPAETSLSLLPSLINFVQGVSRIRIRFDPIVHFKMQDGSVYSNFECFESIATQIASYDIKNVSISWMQLYKKITARLRKAGIEHINISHEDWVRESNAIQEIASAYKIMFHGCCVPGWPRSRCIDGELLNSLHPKGYQCSTRRSKGQRELCGCTESWDIGWYKKCVGGCLYCYANPMEY